LAQARGGPRQGLEPRSIAALPLPSSIPTRKPSIMAAHGHENAANAARARRQAFTHSHQTERGLDDLSQFI
jgi:hypothetical protein